MWSYNSSTDDKKHKFHSFDDVIFAIICVMRFHAVNNKVPDYYIYHDDEKVDTLYGSDLFQLYIENGGETL